jgi:uncharacterized membrane protein
VIRGHPLHAVLSDVPIAATVLGVAFDLLGLLAGGHDWRFAALVTLAAALLGGIAAALVGWWDYQAVPRDHPSRRTGAVHGILNAASLVFLLASLLLRWLALASGGSGASTPAIALLAMGFSLLALCGLGVAGWFGGELVFHEGWRVANVCTES